MSNLPKRKPIRIENYDYSTPGAYFITVCTANREKIFWSDRRGELCSPANVTLSEIGIIVDKEIQKLNTIYDAVRVDKYCIMPDHIHFIISINADENGQTQCAPTISRVIKQFKGSITKQIGRPIWQKSFYDHGIRNQQDYDEIWQYIENNPMKYALKKHLNGAFFAGERSSPLRCYSKMYERMRRGDLWSPVKIMLLSNKSSHIPQMPIHRTQ